MQLEPQQLLGGAPLSWTPEVPELSEDARAVAVNRIGHLAVREIWRSSTQRSKNGKVGREWGLTVYKLRKAVVQPAFGTTKEARGLRRFSFRGLAKVAAEWDLICLTHNLLELWRARTCPAAAWAQEA